MKYTRHILATFTALGLGFAVLPSTPSSAAAPSELPSTYALPSKYALLRPLLTVSTDQAPPTPAPTPAPTPTYFTELEPSTTPVATTGGVVVAVIDSGMDASHPALIGALLPEVDFNANPDVPRFHGTAVASVLLRSDPAARVLPIRVLDAAERTSNEIVALAIRDAVRRGASVINISLGSEAYSVGASPLADAVRFAADNDVVVVAAAGNEGEQGSNITLPAAYDSVIAVGALTASGKIASLSNRGSYVDVTALGENVTVAEPGGGTTVESGTSFAAPAVSGLASALRRLHPDWSAIDVRNHILATAADAGVPGPDPVFGYGRLDPARALASELLTADGVVPQLAPLSGLKVRHVAGGVTLSSRNASTFFVRTPSGERLEVGPSGSYLRVKESDSFSVWSYDRSGAPTVPETHTFIGSKAPRIKATATFKNGTYYVKVTSKLPRGLSVEASFTAPDGQSSFIASAASRRVDIQRADVFVPKISVCFTTFSESFGCRNVKVQKRR
jgi:membrane-anchored mycosin MYCP